MPIYEYRCESCARDVSVFVRRPDGATPICPHCSGQDLRRKMSAFSVRRTGVLSSLDDGEGFPEGLDESDPRAVARWARQMSAETGEPLPPDMEQELRRMEAGEFPSGDGGGADTMDDDDWDV